MHTSWNNEADVVGAGLAGAVTAIEAHGSGSKGGFMAEESVDTLLRRCGTRLTPGAKRATTVGSLKAALTVQLIGVNPLRGWLLRHH